MLYAERQNKTIQQSFKIDLTDPLTEDSQKDSTFEIAGHLPVPSDSGGRMHRSMSETQSLSAGQLWRQLVPPIGDL